jgi:uncharacterized small protein (DUF1192 family)
MTRNDTPVGVASAVDAGPELERLNALPLEERAGALSETVRRLEAELDATEAADSPDRLDKTGRAGATGTGPAGH